MKYLLRYLAFTLMVGGVCAEDLGYWVLDIKNGCRVFSVSTFKPSRVEFLGRCVNGVAEGSGIANWFEFGTMFNGKTEGLWKNGKINGHGIHTTMDGKYVGNFSNGMRDGQGTLFSLNGSVVSAGLWVNDKFTPLSPVQQSSTSNSETEKQSNLSACQGSYSVNWNNCFGTLTISNYAKFIGEFKDGKLNGRATETLNNGDKYDGEFRDGKRNGRGTYTFANGSVISQGIWVDGNFVGLSPAQPIQQVTTPTTEFEKLRAEAELERKRRQELEEQLRLAQQPIQANQPAVSSRAERRVALVIGNAIYKLNPLKNPVNDSTDMARSLRTVGFDVIEANNTTLSQMREATRKFADKLGSSDVGLVYFSGHGIEVKGRNYLIPVNADIKREYEVVDQAFDASQFLEMMDNIRGPNNKRVNILIIDACRNNELQRSWRSTNNGLARMDAPGGTFISFATAPGKVAADGEGRNSPYTKHLLQALKQPNLPIEQVFKVVRRNVMDETKGEQIPWENSSLVGDFYFTVKR